MKYFAMIDGVQRGPFELSEMHEAGVRPDTYVWCKEMADWRPASEVADICRYWRQRLSGTLPLQSPKTPTTPTTPTTPAEFPELPAPDTLFEPEDPATPPRTMLATAIAATLACCPVTGFVAIYYALMTRRLWQSAEEASQGMKESPAATDDLRRRAHEASRCAKMWTGITLFMGLVFWSFAITRAL
ncbi:MAG: GYF domain-containing protein [Muribaculaceae bacterium]|nr:GYF domain-containing protein [Muribaculaceae bacterium]